jgi:hypothetical protein
MQARIPALFILVGSALIDRLYRFSAGSDTVWFRRVHSRMYVYKLTHRPCPLLLRVFSASSHTRKF